MQAAHSYLSVPHKVYTARTYGDLIERGRFKFTIATFLKVQCWVPVRSLIVHIYDHTVFDSEMVGGFCYGFFF